MEYYTVKEMSELWGVSSRMVTIYCKEGRIKGAEKGKDSINNGIQFIQNFEIIIHPRCVNFLTEISNYTWDKDKFGQMMNRPIDDFNHLMDAMRYAVEAYTKNRKWVM